MKPCHTGTIEEYLLPRFDKRDVEECWPWLAAKTAGGYGSCRGAAIAEQNKISLAHRLVWFWKHGPIPKGFFVCHKCDNPICVNPKHLFLGTASDNNKDCIKKKRNRSPQGEQSLVSKLTNTQIKQIRNLQGKLSCTKVGKQFDICYSHVCRIWRKEYWSHI